MAELNQRLPQEPNWKEQLKREIMEDVKMQIKGITQEIVAELKPLLQTASPQPSPPNPTRTRQSTPSDISVQRPRCTRLRAANGLEIPYTGYAVLDLEVEGVKVPERGVVIVEDVKCTHPFIVGMNVIMACWDTLFKCPATSSRLPQFKTQKVWRDAFATCRHIEVSPAEDGLVGFVRLAAKGKVVVPPESEMVVWGRTKRNPVGIGHCALVEPLLDVGASDVGVARALVEVKQGRVPVRVCNPHPYNITLGRFSKLGRLYHIEEADVQGPHSLSLSLEDDGVVVVTRVEVGAASPSRPGQSEGTSMLRNRPDLSDQQQRELKALLQKWEQVISQHEEDFGRTNLVQHQILTGDAAPIRERYRPIPPMLYKEVKTLLSGAELDRKQETVPDSRGTQRQGGSLPCV
uniref:Uncharacterized protein n=1 Tax=Knipowitschia caucasica TaxID=637954 RepID=A0AAV2IY75_KNICA